MTKQEYQQLKLSIGEYFLFEGILLFKNIKTGNIIGTRNNLKGNWILLNEHPEDILKL